MRLSDTIEAFIKTLIQEEDQSCELKRNELAEYFHCAPSQINYVLSTRFTPDHGYIISSQRGGGGCIRIVRIRETARDRLTYLVNERIGESIDETSAQILCSQLAESQFIPLEEAKLMASAVSRQALSLPVPEEIKNMMRARILRSMLTVIAQREK
ncbi:MAG: CtsR family transcriptional regulator [Clostridia bacterium]|nr:CtsR family transcriptional regulator [Clostridia bacterium]